MRAAVACLAAGALAVPATAKAADQLAGVTDGNNLVLFASDAPGEIRYSVPLSGLAAGERIVGLDRRPATGGLVALGATSRIYAVDAASGAATAIGNPFTPALDGANFGFTFDPAADRIRTVSDTGQNFRMNPETANVATDTNLQYAADDPGAGTAPNVIGASYTNSTTSTALYDIDAARDALVIQNPPAAGTLRTVGALGVDVIGPGGFDVSPFTNTAFAALRRAGQTNPELFQINLQTGAATAVGPIAPRLSSRATTDTARGPTALQGHRHDGGVRRGVQRHGDRPPRRHRRRLRRGPGRGVRGPGERGDPPEQRRAQPAAAARNGALHGGRDRARQRRQHRDDGPLHPQPDARAAHRLTRPRAGAGERLRPRRATVP
jgi:hypothetical protein